MSRWNRVYKPVVVLSLVCVVVAGALAVADYVTAPIIEESARRTQEAVRLELLPEAVGFERLTDCESETVDEVYVASNGVGYVVTGTAKGYGGKMTVMVAFDTDGTIKKIKVTEQSETKGIGSKAADDPTYWQLYEGLPARSLTLGQDVDAVTGATKSSRALLEAVNAAIEGYRAAVE